MGTVIEIVLAVTLITAISTDLTWSRIPNWLTFSAAATALAAHIWIGGTSGALFSLLGLGAGLGLFLILYVTGSVGAGDVKLMGTVGALVGPYGAIISGLLALIV